MGKNTFGKTMPRALSQNLKIMGEQIMLARKRRHLSPASAGICLCKT